MAANAQAMTQAFQAGMQGGATRYKNGVMGVTDNPMAKAAAAVADGTWAARTAAAAPRLAAKLSAVTMDQWKSAASTFGAAAYSSSAAKAAANYAKVAPQLAQAAQAAKSAAAAVPKSDPLGRVAASMAAMKSAFGKS